MKRYFSLKPLASTFLGLTLLAAPSAQAENPLERLRRHIHSELFGRSDRDRDCKDRKKDQRHDDDHDRQIYEDRARNGYYDSRPSYSSSAPSFEFRYARRVEEPPVRTYREEPRLEMEVQLLLQQRGYYLGSIDGDIGPETRSAIRHYQFDNDLAPTGRIDRELLEALEL